MNPSNSHQQSRSVLQRELKRPLQNSPLIDHHPESLLNFDSQLAKVEVEAVICRIITMTSRIWYEKIVCAYVCTVAEDII
mmetsp:Transcript_4052/g.5876  ORF Transcript_4052/g.5876 Transcript_4052/m.5876 type:complete len:80 (+) Transcript_4052:314-553(+)